MQKMSVKKTRRLQAGPDENKKGQWRGFVYDEMTENRKLWGDCEEKREETVKNREQWTYDVEKI